MLGETMPKQQKHMISKKEQEDLRSRSVEEQFKNDNKVWSDFLPNQENQSNTGAQAICKRVFMAAQQGGLAIRKEGSTNFEAAAGLNKKIKDNEKFSLFNKVSHGSRILIEIPPLKEHQKGNEFFNWAMTGESDHQPIKKICSSQPALMKRAFGSHDTILVKDAAGKEHHQEILLNPKDPKDLFRIMSNMTKGVHFGVNLGLEGPEDGRHGHLYIYWQPPTDTKPGVFLMGVEGSAPGKSDIHGHVHGPKATSPEFSPTSGQKWRDEKFKNYEGKPDPINGMRVNLDDTKLQAIMKLEVDDFDINKMTAPITVPAPINNSTAKIANEFIKLPIIDNNHANRPPVNVNDQNPVHRQQHARQFLIGQHRSKAPTNDPVLEDPSEVKSGSRPKF